MPNIEIQQKDVFKSEDDDAKYDSPDWEEFSSHDSYEDALCSFIATVNGDGVDDVNLYFRVVNHDTKEVRGI